MQPPKVSEDDKLFYFGRHFFTLDGLWMIEVENEWGREKSLEVDLRVWLRFLKIVYKRIKDRLDADTSRADGIVDVLAFRWSCEEWEYSIQEHGPGRARVTITRCPWHEMMKRNPERHDMIPRICKDICIPIYTEAIASLNPDARVERTKYQGFGDASCKFTITTGKGKLHDN